MEQPEPKNLRKLVKLLKPYFKSEGDRRTHIRLSVGEQCAGSLTWNSPDEVFITDLVENLVNYGINQSGQEVLWLLLEYVKSDLGVGVDVRNRIDKLWAEMTGLQVHVSGARYQDLHSLTVQIRHPESNQIAGVGLLVQDKIITCGQVVRAAGNEQLSFDKNIHIYLPRLVGSRERLRTATVEARVPHYRDDIVVLRLHGDSLPGTVCARVSSASNSHRHRFRTYGYVGSQDLPNDYANGEILGYAGLELEVDCILLKPDDGETIHQGMRGAGVLDLNQDKVIGILIGPLERRQRAEAVDAHIVVLEPLRSILLSSREFSDD